MDNKLARYVAQNSAKRNRNLKYDFMPSLLEIIERPSHKAGTVVVVTIAVLLVVAITWAGLSKLDVVVNGVGNIVPDGKIVDIQPIIGGKVDVINVKVGDYVNEDDVLISLESETSRIDIEQLEYDIEWCKIRLEIAENRLVDNEYVIPIDEYDAKYSNGINQLILEIDMYKIQKSGMIKDLEQAKKELETAEADGRDYMIPALTNQADSLAKSIVSSEKTQKSQMYSLLFSLEREMDGYMAQLEKLSIYSENYLIKAPVSGYVNMLSVVSAGQTVSVGTTVVSIVPNSPEMQFECYVPDKDRAEIAVGMNVTIKLSAFSFSDYGAITGTVTYISPSAFANEKLGNVYVVDIDIDEGAMNPKIVLSSGISGNVEIVVGKRTVLQYFLDPIMGNLRESLKED